MQKRYRVQSVLFIVSWIVAASIFGCATTGKSVSGVPDVKCQNNQNDENIEEGKPARFVKVVMHDKPVYISSSLSPDARKASLLFEYLDAIIDPKDKGVRVKTNTTTFILPVTGNDKELSIKFDIRGFVNTTQGARATLLVQLGGKTILIDLPKTLPPGEEFYHPVSITLPPGRDLQGTLFLLVERDADDEKLYAHLTIDSIDIVMEEKDTESK